MRSRLPGSLSSGRFRVCLKEENFQQPKARPVCHLCVGKEFADALWLHIPGY